MVRQALDLAKTRLLISAVCVVLGFGVIGARLISVSCFHETGDACLNRASDCTGLHTGRATFVDRNGEILATTISTSSLYANAKIILNPQDAVGKLKTVFSQLNEKELLEKLTTEKSFIWIARHLTPQQKAAVIRLGIPGLEFMHDTKRVYPYGPLASHAVGFVDVDNNGISGLEKGLDEQLRLSDEPIQLSIDIRLQHILYDELKKGIEQFSAYGGSGVIMDITTGEIIAMISLPDFDPNKPDVQNAEALFNRNTLGVYEMGSTMKIINTAMVLDAGVATPETKFDATKPMKVGRFFVTDFHPKNTWLNVNEIFVYSSNIGSARMALKAGGERQKMFMEKVGFLKAPTLELPEMGAPLYPRKWKEANTITIAYGYGLSISPLQLALATSGVVTGKMPENATLLKRSVQETKYKKIVAADVAAKVLDLMQESVKSGTSRKAAVPGITVAAKTGTANRRRAHGRGYQKKDVNTTFIGIFPEVPRYLTFIMLDGPKGTKATYGFNTAGWNSAPVAGNVIKRSAPILGIFPQFDKGDLSKMPLVRHVTLLQ